MLTQYLNIHDLLTIKLTRERHHLLDDYLLRTLGQYLVDEVSVSPDLEINVKAPSSRTLYTPGATVLDKHWFIDAHKIVAKEYHKGGQWLAEIENPDGVNQDQPCVVNVNTNHLGRMVYPSDLIYPLIRLLMNLRGVADVHGASVSKDGQGFLFAGRSGVGKTITAVNFIRHGYHLLGDDEVWLRDGQMLSYLTPISIRYTYDPEEALGIKLSYQQRLAIRSKKWLAKLTFGLVTLFTRFRPEEFQSKIATTANLKKAYVFTPSDHFAVEHDIDPSLFIRQILVNNQFEMRGFESYRLAYVHVYPKSELAYYWESHTDNLKRSLSGVACHRILVPRHYTQHTFNQILADVEA